MPRISDYRAVVYYGARCLAIGAVWGGLMLYGSPLGAASLRLDDGTELECQVITAFHDSLIVRDRNGTVQPILAASIIEVVLGQVRGRYLGWADGRFRLELADEILVVREDGAVVEREPLAPAATPPANQPPVAPEGLPQHDLAAAFSEFLATQDYSAVELGQRNRVMQQFYFWLYDRENRASTR